jgi:hypothetical protein
MPIGWAVRLPALALVSYLLLQGAWYWQLKVQAVVQRQPLPSYYQLMYDTSSAFAYVRRNGRLRKAALGLDLKR